MHIIKFADVISAWPLKTRGEESGRRCPPPPTVNVGHCHALTRSHANFEVSDGVPPEGELTSAAAGPVTV